MALAITQIRQVIAANPPVFANGYIFVGHSQGGALARAVVEDMDEHSVRLLVSLAGAQNGIFYGPQPSDALPTLAFVKRLGPNAVPSALFNFSKYSLADFNGTLHFEFNEMVEEQQELQAKVSIMNLARSSASDLWEAANPFLPRINNISPCEGGEASGIKKCKAEQSRRRSNFLRLTSAHFFGSSGDDGMCSTQIRDEFTQLQVIPMERTTDFKKDTYGLKTLHKCGGLGLHEVPNVLHSYWIHDSTPMGRTALCRCTTSTSTRSPRKLIPQHESN